MAEAELDTDYAVLVTECRGIYELRIPELFLVVRGADLQKTYEELVGRKREIIESARAFGALDEVPKAERPALFDEAPRGLLGRVLSRLHWN